MSDDLPIGRRVFRAEVIGIMLALVVQGAGMVWWGASINTRVAQLEAKAATAAHVAEDVARIDERTSNMKDSLKRIEDRLDGQQK